VHHSWLNLSFEEGVISRLEMRTQAKALGSHPSFFSLHNPMKGLIPFFILVLYVHHQQFFLKGSYGMKAHLLKSNPTNKRWAVMMVGAGRTYMFTRNSFMQNVVKQSDPPMDVFVFTKNITNSSCLVDLESMRLLELDSTAIHFDENYLKEPTDDQRQITEDRFVRQQTAAFQMIESYAEQHNINYDYIFYTRPDLYYTLPFKIEELEEKFNNVSGGINGTIFSPECCSWGGWCDQLAAAKYQDFARMIRISREWFSIGDNTIVETAFQARGRFANLSNFDLRLKEDYGFALLRSQTAIQSCSGINNLDLFWTDAACNAYATFDINSTLKNCEILNSSSACFN